MVKRFILIFTILFSCLTVAPCFAKKADTQYWQAEEVTLKVNDLWKVSACEEMYFKDDASDFYYEHTELGATYSGIAKWLDVGAHYRHVENENTSNTWLREEQVGFNFTPKFKFLGCNITDRNRFDYRIRENADDLWRYRNNLVVKFPWKWTKHEIQPYFADEVYVDFDLRKCNENRMYEGFSLKVYGPVSMDIFYMWRRLMSSNKWASQNVIGTKLKLNF